MPQTGQRVLRIVFRADRQQYADVLLPLDIALELQVSLPVGRFFTQLQPFRAVIADHAAPESVVHIERKHLFIPPENGFDD